tara:strand:- start:95 stop:676 length:582 start_codon:yes stop_codon:yes gene_type:complete
MVFGDLHFFDIIIFIGITVFLIYRLRNVLGKRTGFEKKQSHEKTTKDVILKENKNTPDLKENEIKLSKVYDFLEGFNHREFLEGAKFAFETIINAFNQGDKKTLKNLLTKNVYISFEGAINKGENNPGFQFYSLVVDGVEDVQVENKTIKITLKITSEQFKDNDENTVTKKQDIWTFQKEANDNSPIWLLCST